MASNYYFGDSISHYWFISKGLYDGIKLLSQSSRYLIECVSESMHWDL